MCFLYHRISSQTSLYIITYHIISIWSYQSSCPSRKESQFKLRHVNLKLLLSGILHFSSSHIWTEDTWREYVCLVNKCNYTVPTFFPFWTLKVPTDLSKAACSLICVGQLHCAELHVFPLNLPVFFPPMFEVSSYCDLKQSSCFGKRSKIITVLWQCWSCDR